MFEKVEVDDFSIRDLPPARLLVARETGDYFERANKLFKSLFQYIRDNDIKMTTPVEAGLSGAEMRFYVGPDVRESLPTTDKVQVINVPARKVAALGARGGYSEANVAAAVTRLRSWVESQAAWVPSGDAYAVFWNGPFTPWFMKRFEVHLPVSPR